MMKSYMRDASHITTEECLVESMYVQKKGQSMLIARHSLMVNGIVSIMNNDYC